MKALDALFSGQRQKVLGLLLMNPGYSAHVRELARQTGSHPGSLHKELAALADAGLLLRVPQGNQVMYHADTSSPVYEELASIFRKTSGLASVLRAALSPLGTRVTCAFVYGSMARGDHHVGSDIDLMVIGDVDYTTLVTALHDVQASLAREINPSLYGVAEFRQKLSDHDAFVCEVITRPTLRVLGDSRDLGEPGSHQEAESSDG